MDADVRALVLRGEKGVSTPVGQQQVFRQRLKRVFLVLLLDEDELVVADALLHDLLGLTEHCGFERLLSLQVGQGGADGGWELNILFY